MDHVTAYPLTWPDGWQRSTTRKRSPFASHSIARATHFVLQELARMGVPDYQVIISSDLRLRNDGQPYSSQRTPEDPGVAVWWRDGEDHRVIALDQYERIADNLYAVGKTIRAMRGIDRWGGGEILRRTFTGFAALEHITENWRDVLEFYGDDRDECSLQIKRMKMKAHPDRGGNDDWFHRVSVAVEQAEDYFRNRT